MNYIEVHDLIKKAEEEHDSTGKNLLSWLAGAGTGGAALLAAIIKGKNIGARKDLAIAKKRLSRYRPGRVGTTPYEVSPFGIIAGGRPIYSSGGGFSGRRMTEAAADARIRRISRVLNHARNGAGRGARLGANIAGWAALPLAALIGNAVKNKVQDRLYN